MSNLRDRLKKISAQRAEQPAMEPTPPPTCARCVHELDAPELVLDPKVLVLMGGEAFEELLLRPEELIFVDTETTGLSGGVGTVAFEVGVGEIIGQRMRITQLWMRDYNEEEDLLGQLDALFAGKKAIVSFNGKSFDLPLLVSRCTLYRLRAPWRDLPHLDLLHPARRLYKLRLKACNLGHLEETVLDIHRTDDIPGNLVPGIWAEYLRTRREELLTGIFDHNLQDVHTLALLLRRLCDAHAHPAEQMHMEDVFSIGKVLDRAGQTDLAEQCYARISVGSCRVPAGQALHRLYRRASRIQDAQHLLEQMALQGGAGIYPYVELAKLYEHRLHDVTRALYYTDLALAQATAPEEIQSLTRRRARLAQRRQRKA